MNKWCFVFMYLDDDAYLHIHSKYSIILTAFGENWIRIVI